MTNAFGTRDWGGTLAHTPPGVDRPCRTAIELRSRLGGQSRYGESRLSFAEGTRDYHKSGLDFLRGRTSPLPQCARNTLRDRSPSTFVASNEDREPPAEICLLRAESVEREEICVRVDERLS